jgi:hypothetical protein
MDLEITIDAHPPGVLKSIIYGNLQSYWKQNMQQHDFIHVAGQFANHLVARGRNPDHIRELFLEVALTLSRQPTQQNGVDSRNTLFFHWEYHPHGISRQAIRQAYTETCERHGGLGFDRFVVAYS